MATETFDKTIWIDEKAAEIIANELEKPREPYVNPLNTEEVNRSAKEWLEEYRLQKSMKRPFCGTSGTYNEEDVVHANRS